MNKDTVFISPTWGNLNLEKVRERIVAFIKADTASHYRIVIGSDSQPKNNNEVDFVVALVLHRVGSGAIYFWKRFVKKEPMAIKQRIFAEASYSLDFAYQFLEGFKGNGISNYDVEIHIDIGNHGPTRELINEVTGMVRSCGFAVKTKPDAYGASTVADRHT